MPLFQRTVPEQDKLVEAQVTAEAALSAFEDVVRDLEHANVLLSQVEDEEAYKVQVAKARGQAAFDAKSKNIAIAGRITALLS